uniref:Peptidase family M54 n=1 Tax=Pithovirus LCPAC101 TaxID=2506586 RepID=A0A481Z1X6_9VIRU|nr:MAG: peptidase family M54 [Pithovirus LCPAC101]
MNIPYTAPTKERNIIYIVPLDTDLPNHKTISEYVGIFFQMDVIVLERHHIDTLSVEIRKGQYLATDILSYLKKILPSDAFCIMAITTKDLYEGSSDFVFGLSSYSERVGIFSVARFSTSLYDEEGQKECFEEFGIDLLQILTNDSVMNRSLKILTHEIMHSFSMEHCTYFNCLLCGCNSVIELDRWSFTLCPVCIQKLYIAHPFDVHKREQELSKFYKNNNIYKNNSI